jgi:hypothetical protein
MRLVRILQVLGMLENAMFRRDKYAKMPGGGRLRLTASVNPIAHDEDYHDSRPRNGRSYV